MGLRDRISEWLTCLLRVLLLMWMSLFDMFHRSHFLKVTKEVESVIVASHDHMFTQVDWLLGWTWEEGVL